MQKNKRSISWDQLKWKLRNNYGITRKEIYLLYLKDSYIQRLVNRGYHYDPCIAMWIKTGYNERGFKT